MIQGQSRKHSLLEAVSNNFVGYAISLMLQIWILDAVGCSLPLSTNILIGFVFAAASIARSYALRRAFNWWNLYKAQAQRNQQRPTVNR